MALDAASFLRPNDPDEPKRYATHIQGYDYRLEGGIPEGHIVLLSGTAGTMKTSLAYYILYHNALQDIPGIYITFEQSRESILRQMRKLGFEKDVSDKLEVYDISRTRDRIEEYDLSEGGKIPWMSMLDEVQRIIERFEDREILVIDSLNALYLLTILDNPRNDIYHFFRRLKNLNITSVLISEMKQNSDEFCNYDEDFLVDGVIFLSLRTVGEVDVQRMIRTVKMREVNHDTGFFTLLFEQGEFSVTQVITE